MSDSPPFPALPKKDRGARLRRSLLAWYQTQRRDLPWRRTRDPYAIWISEAMLQQTRVATVIDYWRRFLTVFPSIADLAAADEDAVLAAWSGLGYYRRARSLHAAAQAIVERHGGRFPANREQALALPGVGEYTAGAVLSIAYDMPEALVDGNVERVLARVLGAPGAAGSGPLKRFVWAVAHELMPEDDAGLWNQALMELGALVCTPTQPRCSDCPWKRSCAAWASGSPTDIPAPKTRRATQRLDLQGLWVVREGRVVLMQRPEGGAMAGMWELPTRRSEESLPSTLWSAAWPAGLRPRLGAPLMEAQHAITHHRIRIQVLEARVAARIPSPAYEWDFANLEGLPLTGITKKVLAQLGRP